MICPITVSICSLSVLNDNTLERAAFVVVEGSVIMMEVDLEIHSVREDEGIPLENLHIKIINVIKKYY